MSIRYFQGFLISAFALGAAILPALPADADIIYNAGTWQIYSSAGSALGSYTASNMIDNNKNTFAALRTSGTASAENPTTGHVVFDLGEPYFIHEFHLFARVIDNLSDYNPREVRFFYFDNDDPTDIVGAIDDITGDPNIVLMQNHEFSALINGESEAVVFDEVIGKQYLGMRVDSSYEQGPNNWNFQIGEIGLVAVPVPEPGTAAMLLVAVSALLLRRRRGR